MNLSSIISERIQKLPAALTRTIVREHDLRVPLRDGTVLLADRWYPATGGDGLPTVLIRTYYGRHAPTATAAGIPLAERGFQVLVVSSRGTFGSAGEADPFRREREDGMDTVAWMTRQPWFGGSIVLFGASYLGFTQWAIAHGAPAEVKAMIPIMTSSSLMPDFLHADRFNLEVPFSWGVQVATQEEKRAMVRSALREPAVVRAMRVLPLRDADVAVLGRHDPFIQNALAHPAGDPFWDAADHRATVPQVTVPTSLIGGWYDILLPGLVADFVALQDAGRHPRMMIGPWQHLSLGTGGDSVREALEFGMAHARGEEPPHRAPVRLFVMGQNEWRGFDSWPPAGYEPRAFHLQADAALAATTPSASPPDRYRYDPADPTPAVGGARLMFRAKRGAVDNRRLEARADVLVYTSAPLEHDLEVVGEVSAAIWFRSDRLSADLFVRVCDVDKSGRSVNVCDGFITIDKADQLAQIAVELSPTAYLFRRGHRLRVQVSGGAFPRYNRNLGGAVNRADATEQLVAQNEVYHDADHASAIVLPVRQA